MTKEQQLLLALLAATVDHKIDRCKPLLPVDEGTWTSLLDLAAKHGVTGLVFSAVEHLPREVMPPMDQLMDLLGQAEYQKTHYQSQFDTAQKFARALKARGAEMKVLKGISFSTYYDQPELRECGDCDCYLSLLSLPSLPSLPKPKAGSTGFEIGNKTIEEIGGKGEFGSYKHSHLYLDSLMFENHHYITDFNGTKQGKVIELLLEKAIDSAPGTPIPNSDMVRPCAHFNALHLIRHAQGNFILEGMTLRMIYDWAVLLRAVDSHSTDSGQASSPTTESIDWKQLYADFESCGLREFVDVMTSICVEHLGLQLSSKDITLCKDMALVDEVLADTLADNIHYSSKETGWHKFVRILSRYKRYWHYRRLSIESIPTLLWNSFAYSSYMQRNITLD